MTTATLDLAMQRTAAIAKRARIHGEDPEDLVQEAHLVVVELLTKDHSLEYICRAVQYRMKQILRRRMMERRFIEYVPVENIDQTHFTVTPSGEVEKIEEFFKGLPPKERAVAIAAATIENPSTSKIAKATGYPTMTTWRLRRAVAQKAIQRGIGPRADHPFLQGSSTRPCRQTSRD